MAKKYDNRNRIGIWKRKPDDHPDAPDYRIVWHDENEEAWECALWKVNSDSDKAPVFSGTLKPKEARDDRPQPSREPGEDDGEFDDDIPF